MEEKPLGGRFDPPGNRRVKGPIEDPINWGYNIKLIVTATEDYAKKWAEKESQEYECLQD